MPFSRDAEAALLKWVNTFPLESQIASLTELCDGLVFCRMLEDLDPDSAPSELEKNAGGSSKWLRKKMCLEAVYKSLLRFIRDHIGDMDYLTTSNIDFDKMAEDNDVQHAMKLLVIFLMATLNTSDDVKRERYVLKIQSLDQVSQVQIMTLVEEMNNLKETGGRIPNDQPLPGKLNKDFELAFEEEHATLYAEHETLKKKHADFLTRFAALEMTNEDLHQQNETMMEQLTTLQNANNSDQVEYVVNGLKRQVVELEAVIATHEEDLEISRITKERQEKELNSTRRTAQVATELDDEVRALRAENASLTKKANMVDHYQKKLESQAGIDKENQRLREKVETLEYLEKSYDETLANNTKLANSVDEYRRRFQQYEAETVEMKELISNFQVNLQSRAGEVEKLNQKVAHDEQFIRDLQEQLTGGGEAPSSPRSDKNEEVPSTLTLEDELDQSDSKGLNLQLEISRLQAENKLLLSGGGIASADLRVELAAEQKLRKRLEDNNQEMTEKHALVLEQLTVALDMTPGDKLVAKIDALMKINPSFRILTTGFHRDTHLQQTRKAFTEANIELTKLKKRVEELETDLTSCKRELLVAKTDLEAINDEEIEALEKFKQMHHINTTSTQNDLQILQGKQKDLEIDLQQQQKHLIEALLAKDKLAKELEALKGGTSALDALKQQTTKQENLIDDLQKRLKEAEEGGIDAQKAANEALIKNLTRENSMIATAWYDLTSRLQSNHVVLQRRQDAPKSWLNKQRQIVNATPRR